MPHQVNHVSHTGAALRGAIRCRKNDQQPFCEIDENHLHRSRLLPARRHSVKVCKFQIPRRKYDLPSSTEIDVFCTIPVEESERQGVFAVRDVIVAERPIYEFSSETDTDTLVSLTDREKKSTHLQHSLPNKQSCAEGQATGALEDWSQFLDLLLPNLCATDQFKVPNHSNETRAAAHGKNIITKSKHKIDVNCKSNSGACFKSKLVSHDDSQTPGAGARRRQPPSPTRQSLSPVVYPIARYPSHLNSMHLVEQRRLSLREHLTFRPVPPAE